MIITINDGDTYLALMKDIDEAQQIVDQHLDREEYDEAAEWADARNDRMIYLYEFLEERLP